MKQNCLVFVCLVAVVSAAACSSEPTSKQGLGIRVAVPVEGDDNPLLQAGAAFVAVTASGDNGDLTKPVVQPIGPKASIELPFIPYGSNRQVRVEVYSKGANGQPEALIGRGMSMPKEVADDGKIGQAVVYLTRNNRFAPAVKDDGTTAALDVARAGACAVAVPAGGEEYVFVLGGAAPGAGATADLASFKSAINSSVLYNTEKREMVAGPVLQEARAGQSCALGQSTVAVVGGYVNEGGKLNVSNSIEFFDGASLSFQKSQANQPDLVKARAGATVVRMFPGMDYFLILGGKGEGSTKGCGVAAPCASNTWEVWHPQQGVFNQGLLGKPRYNHGATFIQTSKSSGYVVLVGGENDDEGVLGDFEVLAFNARFEAGVLSISSQDSPCPGDPSCKPPSAGGLDEWAWKPLSLPLQSGARTLPGVAYVSSPPQYKGKDAFHYVVMAGGFSDVAHTKAESNIDVFELGAAAFVNQPGALKLAAPTGHPLVATPSRGTGLGQMLVAGGSDKSGKASLVYFHEATNPKIATVGNVAEEASTLPDGGRLFGSATPLNTGVVLVTGGVDPGNPADASAGRTAVWLWNPY
jgi:hypothetical protein